MSETTAAPTNGAIKLQLRGPIGRRPMGTPSTKPAATDGVASMHPEIGLAIDRIQRIYRMAEDGNPSLQCDLFEGVIERDAHLRCQIEMRISAVAGVQWILQPGGEAAADIEAARLLDDRLRRVPNVHETIAHLLTMHAYGWAASEIQWEDVDGLFAPVWFENVAHRRFVFDRLGLPRLVTKTSGHEGAPLELGRWLYVAGRHRRAPMAGLMRTAVYYSLFKSKALVSWVLFNDRFGFPIPIGTYAANTPPEEKAALVEALGKLGEDFFAAFEETCKIASLAVAGTGTPDAVQGALIALCNAEQSKLFTGATLTSGEGTSAGSYAQATVHENRFYGFTAEDAEVRVPQIVQQQISTPFVQWNGLKGRPPRIKLHLVREVEPVNRLAIFKGCLEMGMELDEDQVRAELQLKSVTGKALGKPPAPEPTPAEPGGDMPGDMPEDMPEDPEDAAA